MDDADGWLPASVLDDERSAEVWVLARHGLAVVVSGALV
jgi:hypothetical protein